ncbi:hypothetical protein K1T71_015299, partial [Dendrolimus kikuchii]
QKCLAPIFSNAVKSMIRQKLKFFLKIHGCCKECAATFDAHSSEKKLEKLASGDG